MEKPWKEILRNYHNLYKDVGWEIYVGKEMCWIYLKIYVGKEMCWIYLKIYVGKGFQFIVDSGVDLCCKQNINSSKRLSSTRAETKT